MLSLVAVAGVLSIIIAFLTGLHSWLGKEGTRESVIGTEEQLDLAKLILEGFKKEMLGHSLLDDKSSPPSHEALVNIISGAVLRQTQIASLKARTKYTLRGIFYFVVFILATMLTAVVAILSFVAASGGTYVTPKNLGTFCSNQCPHLPNSKLQAYDTESSEEIYTQNSVHTLFWFECCAFSVLCYLLLGIVLEILLSTALWTIEQFKDYCTRDS